MILKRQLNINVEGQKPPLGLEEGHIACLNLPVEIKFEWLHLLDKTFSLEHQLFWQLVAFSSGPDKEADTNSILFFNISRTYHFLSCTFIQIAGVWGAVLQTVLLLLFSKIYIFFKIFY